MEESPSPSPPPPPPPPPSTSIIRYLINFDTTVSLTLYTLTQPILPRPVLKLLEISGDGRLFFPIILSVLLSPLPSASPILRSVLVNLLIGAVLDLILIGTIKHLVRRPRPVYNKHMFLTFAVDHWSFPSGHASRVCFIASLIYLSSHLIPNVFVQLKSDLLGLDEFASVNRLNSMVIAWAFATSVSRVLLGRHFVMDVAAGAGLDGTAATASALNHIDGICRQKITWAEGDSEDEKFGLTHLKLEFSTLKLNQIGEMKIEEDRSAVENLSPHGVHYITYDAEKKVKLRCFAYQLYSVNPHSSYFHLIY